MHEYVIFPPYSSSFTLSLYFSPPPLVPTPRLHLFYLRGLHFGKQWFLFKIALQGDSLWHFCVCTYYNASCFMSSIFVLSTLIPFLWWYHQV
jgi:hypothetical protein